MNNTFFSALSFLLITGVVTPSFGESPGCADDCNRNSSTTPSELQSCLNKCKGEDMVTPVVTDSSNEDKKDSRNPENSSNPHRN